MTRCFWEGACVSQQQHARYRSLSSTARPHLQTGAEMSRVGVVREVKKDIQLLENPSFSEPNLLSPFCRIVVVSAGSVL